MRAFLALSLSDDQRGALSDLQDHLRCGRIVDEDDLHLTLVFFAQAGRDALEELDLTLGLRRPGPVPVAFRGLSMFGSANPRSVHAAVVPDPRLMHLQAGLASAARRCGIALPHRRFVPHVTLARFAHRMPPEDHARLGRFLSVHGDARLPADVAADLHLYRSTLHPDGPRYDLLESYPLS